MSGTEEDPEWPARVRRALIQQAAIKLEALRAAAPPGTYEHAFLRREAATFDDVDLALLDRLAWHYRGRLPTYLRPKLNPTDPIVRETRNA